MPVTNHGPRFTISLKRSTQNLQLSTSRRPITPSFPAQSGRQVNVDWRTRSQREDVPIAVSVARRVQRETERPLQEFWRHRAGCRAACRRTHRRCPECAPIERGMRNPITGIACCADAAIGSAAAPPSIAMKSRRRMSVPWLNRRHNSG